jgi:copper chaperone CopZ
MEELLLNVPRMWADHHILAVRDALSQVAGVTDVVASSMYRDVVIRYDATVTNPDALASALAQAGYGPGSTLELPTHLSQTDDASDWFQFQERVTVTDRRDLEASGDHRKY